jgi:D-aspartate ligase
VTRALASGPLPPVALFDNFWAPTLAFAYSLGRKAVPLHVYGSGAARWSRYCTRRSACPPPERADLFVPWLRERIKSGEIARIAPTTDLIAYYASLLREDFPAEIQRTIPSLTEIESSLIKSRFSQRCEAIGQPVPRTHNPENLAAALLAAQELQYPLVMKPKSHLAVGFSERGCVIRDEQALRQNFRAYSFEVGQESIGTRYPEILWPMLQRYLKSARSKVYSVSGFKDADAGIIASSLSFKCEQSPADTGTSTMQVSHSDDRILQVGLKAVDSLITCGIFEIELVADNDELLAIDLNPRAFGFINLDIALGRDLPWLWFCSTMGAVERSVPSKQADVIEARNSIIHFLIRLSKKRPAKPAAAPDDAGDARRPHIPLLGNWSDPLPLLLANARILRHPRSLLRTVFH